MTAAEGHPEETTPLQPSGFLHREDSTEYHIHRLWETVREHVANPTKRDSSGRLNSVVIGLWVVTLLLLLFVLGIVGYRDMYQPTHNKRIMEKKIREHADAARERVELCRDFTWETACDALGDAGARRRKRRRLDDEEDADDYFETQDAFENDILNSDDPTIIYDQFCLRKYRLNLYGDITFPYHSGQLLTKGGNQTSAFKYYTDHITNDRLLQWPCSSFMEPCEIQNNTSAPLRSLCGCNSIETSKTS